MQTTRVTDLIRLDHIWFRNQFAALEDARNDTATLTSLWTALSARLEVHAAAEEALFYPRLLKDDPEAADDTKDAIRDHNDIRDGIREAEKHRVGDEAWWEGVNATERANTEHMEEEEQGPLIEFEDNASADEQAEVASRFASFEIEHAGARDVSLEDKDPEEYLADNS